MTLPFPLRVVLFCAALLCLLALLPAGFVRANSAVPEAPKLQDPDQGCVTCHAAIVASYRRTPMAQGSGPGLAGFVPGSFQHAESGIRYTVETTPAGAALRYTRGDTLEGSMPLPYYIGSGHRGRTYLYQVAGYWYELPINWYSKRGVWDMLPGYAHAATMPTAQVPVDGNCLHCHATGIGEAAPGAPNHFRGAPFAQGGIGCSACHGDPAAHLASAGRVALVDPRKLSTTQRDSICLQCHLEGEALAYLPGKSLVTFEPGQDLAETAVYFVRANRAGGGGRATSQYEALLRSACRRAVGDSLTCTTCHAPHASPATAAERVAWFRGRCLSCHTGPAIATHHAEQPDCAHCHMPTRLTTDLSHEQVTDHDIEARPRTGDQSARDDDTLLAVGGVAAGPRELGIGYAQLAERGDLVAAKKARALLEDAEAHGANDAVLHARLGFLLQRAGETEHARNEYVAALNDDPWEASALANLAVLDASDGQFNQGVRLLDRLVTANPGQTAAGMNLAVLLCAAGDVDAAGETLRRVAQFNPDDPTLRAFRTSGNYAGHHCAWPHEEEHAR